MTHLQPIPHGDRPMQTLSNPTLPLAVYREIAAHLCQVPGVTTELLPQTTRHFDYYQSQIGGLIIRHADPTDPTVHQRVAQILAHYSDRYGAWQTVE